jgi:exonuclease VII small subunit
MKRNENAAFYDMTETLEMRVISLEREIERLNEVITQFIMGRSL